MKRVIKLSSQLLRKIIVQEIRKIDENDLTSGPGINERDDDGPEREWDDGLDDLCRDCLKLKEKGRRMQRRCQKCESEYQRTLDDNDIY